MKRYAKTVLWFTFALFFGLIFVKVLILVCGMRTAIHG